LRITRLFLHNPYKEILARNNAKMSSFDLSKQRKKEDELINRLLRYVSTPISALCVKYTTITPNMVTFASMILLLLGTLFIIQTQYILGALCTFVYIILDFVDGEIARAKKVGSKLGQWFDGLVGFIGTPLIIMSLAVSLESYLALFIGALAALAFPMQFMLLYGFKVEVLKSTDKMQIPIKGKLDILRHLYGISLFYVLLSLSLLINKPLWILVFVATIGNLFWICIMSMQLMQLRGT
jgi:phosphatidylglycerophosphate synthase